MPHRRLRTLALALAAAVVAGSLSVLASPPALALDAPANPSPSGAQTGIPTFSWDRVAGATTYDFQISTSDQFTTTLVNVTTVQRQYVPKIQLPTGTQLYWRVRGTGGGETWTTTLFSRNTVGAPTLIGPADAAELTQPDNPVTLSWQPVPGADSYDVQYGTDPNFVDQTTTKSVEASSYVVPLQTPGTYVWRVRGVLANGVFTAWSGGTNPLPPARTYKVMGLANDSAIPPTSPPDDANQALTDVVLDWEPIKGAKSYEIQISTDAAVPAEHHRRPAGHRLRHPLLAAEDAQQRPVLLADPGHRRGRLPARLVQPPGLAVQADLAGPADAALPAEQRDQRPEPLLLPVDAGQARQLLRGADQQWRRVPHAGAVPAGVHDGAHDAGVRRRARQLLAHRSWHLQLAGHGQGRVLQRDAGHRRDRRPGRDVHLQAAAGHDDRAAQRQHLRQPLRPEPVARGTRPHVEPGSRGGQVQGDHPGDDDAVLHHRRAQLRAPIPGPWHLLLGRPDGRRARRDRRRARDWSADLHDQAATDGRGPPGPPRTVRPDARARPAAGGRPADTRPTRSSARRTGSRRSPGARSAGSTTTRSAWRARATPSPGSRETSSGPPATTSAPPASTPGTTSGTSRRSARTGRPSPEAPAPSRSCRCRTSRSSPTRPP